MILFKKLRYKNFLSTGNTFTEYDLNSKNQTLIIGKNGSGKSTLLDALTFSLFGKAYRNINKPALINSINQKDCMVELEFSIGNKEYKIRRGLKPNVFDINVDGAELDKNASVKDFQNNLESSVLKMNYKSFCSVVILGARYDSFMNMSPADRRKVVEDVLDIEIFSEMNVVLRDRLAKLKELVRENDSMLRLNEEKKSLQKSNIETTIKERETDIQLMKSKIDVMQVDIDNDVMTLIEDKVNMSRIKKDISEKRSPLENKKKAVEDVFRDLNKRQIAIEKEKKFYTDNDSCPTCQQNIDNRVDILAKRIETSKEIDVAVHKLDDTLHAIAVEMEGVVKMEAVHDGFSRAVAAKESRIRTGTDRITSLNDEIAALRVRNDSPTDAREKVLKDLEDAIADLDIEKYALSQQKKSHDIAYTMLKDSGIKSKIIENYLPIINAQINEHLQDLHRNHQVTSP